MPQYLATYHLDSGDGTPIRNKDGTYKTKTLTTYSKNELRVISKVIRKHSNAIDIKVTLLR